jgi:hypothetical protein
MARLRLRLLDWAGKLANLAGMPCIVREGEYSSPSAGVTVRVRSSSLFTVVTVNGVDVYFYRLTGGIDGVGVNQTSGYSKDDIPRSIDSAA